MSSLGDRIKAAAQKIGGLDELAKVLEGVGRRTLSDYVSGKTEPRISTMVQIAAVTASDLNWLLVDPAEGTGTFLTQMFSGGNSSVQLPRYDVRASAGAGALVLSPDVSEYLSVGRDWLRRALPPWAPSNAVVGVLEGGGDSMEPTIRNGDLIMVVQEVDWRVVELGGIFVFSLDHDRLLLKRLQVMTNGDLKIISDNTAYEPEVIAASDLADRIIIHGLVFFVGGSPRRF